jgi:hypothetical protein
MGETVECTQNFDGEDSWEVFTWKTEKEIGYEDRG